MSFHLNNAQHLKAIINSIGNARENSIEGKTVRMDSLTVSSSCRKLSRLEIIYSTIAQLIKVIDKNTTLPERFKPYLKEDHYNDTIYRVRDKDLNSKIKKVLMVINLR
ncbi:MAG TPA: hypothetical protein ENI51_10955 [Candidatus Atribacteria bacterium]|nr:hypothetical protein [Candidatus Atribacteria bacterium]